ncbi:MAG: ferredoxin [Flavobacteriaceae bacterium]|jgi:ferredoxin|nr:ferredoxin [Flavobacteriaceae bacterium]
MNQDIKIHLMDREGNSHQLTAPVDMQLNLMELCKAYEFPIEGTCGGMALCASCQCYINSNHELPERSNDEEAMLAEAFHVKENSRLGCQIYLTPELNGLSVTLAPQE